MADPITWYALGRTVDDIETILEAVDAKILTHNLDPSAHGQTGEVVFEHRTASLLDHLFGSVDMKHLVEDKMMAFSCFESLDGWYMVADDYGAGVLGAYIYTSSVLNNTARLYRPAAYVTLVLDPTKNPFFQTTVLFETTTQIEAYIGTGSYPGDTHHDSFGYKIHDAAVYAYWTKAGTQYTSLLDGVTTTDVNVYRAYIDSTESKIYFYVNNVLKYTADANFPTSNNNYLFTYWVKTTTTSARAMYMIDFLFEQDR